MVDGGKSIDRPPGDPLSRRIGCHKLWMRLLQISEAVEEPIKFGIGDRWIVQYVIPLFVLTNSCP